MASTAVATDTRVLATYWILASNEEIQKALKHLEFEMDLRRKRGDA
jgi:hypothetical protein